MIIRKKNKKTPELNTTSTADISFMLLIFFLVATSMDINKGHSRQLHPIEPQEEKVKEKEIKKENIIEVIVSNRGKITIDNQIVDDTTLRQKIKEHIISIGKEHIIKISTENDADYNTYFRLQNAIIDVYKTLRSDYLKNEFDKNFSDASEEQIEMARLKYPQRISEDNE